MTCFFDDLLWRVARVSAVSTKLDVDHASTIHAGAAPRLAGFETWVNDTVYTMISFYRTVASAMIAEK